MVSFMPITYCHKSYVEWTKTKFLWLDDTPYKNHISAITQCLAQLVFKKHMMNKNMPTSSKPLWHRIWHCIESDGKCFHSQLDIRQHFPSRFQIFIRSVNALQHQITIQAISLCNCKHHLNAMHSGP